jgi:hypothetical protein
MSLRARCTLSALVALTLLGCADSPRRTEDIVAPISLDASASTALLECPASGPKGSKGSGGPKIRSAPSGGLLTLPQEEPG